MASQNQHFLPQWLLKRFSADGGSENRVWCHEREKSFLANTRNIGTEGNYFGAPDTSEGAVEAELSRMESKYAEAVRRVSEKGSIGREHQRTLACMFADLCIRPRSFRAGIAELASGAVRAMEDHVRRLTPEELIELATKDSPDRARQIRALGHDSWRGLLAETERLRDQTFLPALGEMRGTAGEQARKDHSSKFLEAVRRRRSWFKKSRWKLLATDERLILGDVGVVSYRWEQGEFAPGGTPGDRGEALSFLLPIGPRHLLVYEKPALDARATEGPIPKWNLAVARLCERFFVSAANDELEAELRGEIGRNWERWRELASGGMEDALRELNPGERRR